MTVFDLLAPHKGIFDLDEVQCKSRVIAYDGKDGKIVFDTNKNKEKFYRKFMSCEILSIWADAKRFEGIGYGCTFEPLICVFLKHEEIEKAKEEFKYR